MANRAVNRAVNQKVNQKANQTAKKAERADLAATAMQASTAKAMLCNAP